MSASIYKQSWEGAGPVLAALTVPVGTVYRLHSASIKFNAAPTTSESLTITYDAQAGVNYDVVLYTINPSITAVTSLIWKPDELQYLHGGDVIRVAYNNNDTRTWGVQIIVEEV